jgi:hypothetical protein
MTAICHVKRAIANRRQARTSEPEQIRSRGNKVYQNVDCLGR